MHGRHLAANIMPMVLRRMVRVVKVLCRRGRRRRRARHGGALLHIMVAAKGQHTDRGPPGCLIWAGHSSSRRMVMAIRHATSTSSASASAGTRQKVQPGSIT